MLAASGLLSVSNTLGSNIVCADQESFLVTFLPCPCSLKMSLFGVLARTGAPARAAEPDMGWTAPGATVSVGFLGQTFRTTAGSGGGLWKTALPPQPATTTPAEITIRAGSEVVTLSNVLFGDVILRSACSIRPSQTPVAFLCLLRCAGCRVWCFGIPGMCAQGSCRCACRALPQSNMEFVLSSAINATDEIKRADHYPLIRVVDGPQQNADPLPL